MKCSKCMAELTEGSSFCPNCGNPVEAETAAEKAPEKTRPAEVESTQVKAAEEISFCPECGSKVGRDDDFCDNCGFRLKESTAGQTAVVPAAPKAETNFCPNCGTMIEPGGEFCGNCGFRLGDETGAGTGGLQPEVSGKKTKLPLAAGIAAVAVVVAGALIVPKLMSSGGSKGNTLMYLREDSVYSVSLDKLGKEPVEYTNDAYASSSERNVLSGLVQGYQMVSADGKYKFYMEDIGYDSNSYQPSFTLYYKKSQKDEGTKIDSQITRYKLTADNRVVYIKNENLYISDLNDKKKITSEVNYFLMDEAGKTVVWSVYNSGDDTRDLYMCDLSAKKIEEQKLSSGISDYQCSGDLSSIYIVKNEAIYLIKDFGKEEKLLNDVENIAAIDWKNNTFYYGQSEDASFKAAELVEDDMAEADSRIVEPQIQNYQHKEPAGNAWYSYERTVTDRESYEADYEKYREKLRRDRLREELKEKEVSVTSENLYYFEGGEKTLVSEDCLEEIDYSDMKDDGDIKPYLVYTKCMPEDSERVKLSQISSVNEVVSQFYDMRRNSAVSCVSVGGTEVVLELEEDARLSSYSALDKEKDILYMLMREDEEADSYILISVDLSDKNLGQIQERDDDVDNLETAGNGYVYYIKDVTDRGIGDLYCNGEMVQADVALYKTKQINNTGAVGCIVDPNNDRGTGTLVKLEGGKETKLADDVNDWYAIDGNSILMLTEFNYDRGRGDLKYYNGKTTENIDVDVRAVFCPEKKE